MLARIHKSLAEKDNDKGFTLIELLVVMIIIGILAAIAVPVFLNQRKKAVDTSIKADMRAVAVEMETYYTDNQAYLFTSPSAPPSRVVTVATGQTVTVSSGNAIGAVPLATATTQTTLPTAGTWSSAVGYCMQGTNAKGSTTAGFYYNSLLGGFTTTACP